MTGKGPFIQVFKVLEEASRKKKKKTPCKLKALFHLFESLFCYQSPLVTYRSAWLIISKAMCGLSYSRHLPAEAPSLTDFPNQKETIHKGAEKQTLRPGGFEYSFFPTNK